MSPKGLCMINFRELVGIELSFGMRGLSLSQRDYVS